MNTPPPAFAVVVLATMIILPTTVQAQADVLKSAHAFLDTFSRDITDGAVTLGTPLHVDVDGNRAYVVIPSTYDFKLKGKAVKETGSLFTFAMLKGPKGWRIVGWSWAKNNGPA